MKNRIILIVLDSAGIGELPDAASYHDEGSNTFKTCFNTGDLYLPNMERLGLYRIDGMEYAGKSSKGLGAYARLAETSKGKDTTIGHWEIAGVISPKPLPVYPNGFPEEIVREFEEKTHRKVLCNKPYSGTGVLLDYGREQKETGGLIVYTSADSVFQIAANEEDIPVSKLYEYCEIARDMLTGEHGVGRVIARPYVGTCPDYVRTSNRHDYSLLPPKKTMCDYIKEAGIPSVGIGKIFDIFAGQGITESFRTKDNDDGIRKTIDLVKETGEGLLFVNLVDFDMKYGHRNDAPGYTNALNAFDVQLGELIDCMHENDILMITADHGCDPGTESTDHSREYTPLLVYGRQIEKDVNLGTRDTFADIASTVLELLNVKGDVDGNSFASIIRAATDSGHGAW